MPDLSPKRQLYLLFSFYCFSTVFASIISIAFPGFTSGQVSKLFLYAVSIFSFLIPAFIAFKLFSTQKLIHYWGLSHSFSSKSFCLTVLVMVCCIILMNWLAEINKLIPLFHWMKEDQIKATAKLKQYLVMDNFWQILLNLFIFSFVPSFCEEVFFRGTMQPLWYKYFTKPWVAIFMTAFIFSFLHFQFSGFLPRLLAGVVFGGIFYLTGSLWLSVISHVLYNACIVVLNYMNQYSPGSVTAFGNLLLSPMLIVSAALIIVLLFYQLQKDSYKKQHYSGR
jgi:membrane protease YdiL (CAAX protease family)